MKLKLFSFVSMIVVSAVLSAQFRIFDDMYGLKSSSSAHFNYIYKKELSAMIPETAVIAEALYDTLSRLLGTTPMSRINLLLTDQSDITNGLATPLLNPTVNIYLTFPDQSFTAKNYDWTTFVLSHELTHIFQTTSVNPKCLKACYNNILYLGYSGLPSYMLEGLAVYNESTIQKGRLHDTHFESILRTMIIDKAVQPLDRATAYFNRNWPFSTLSYLYGAYIVDEYVNEYNVPLPKFVRTDKWACLPYTWLFPDASYFMSTGILPNDVLKSVIEKAEERAENVLSSNIVNERLNLTVGAYDNSSPLVMKGDLYYVSSDSYMNNRIVKRSGASETILSAVTYTNGLKGSGSKIYYDDIELYSGVDYFFNIYELNVITKHRKILRGTRRGMYPSVNGSEMYFVRNSALQQWIIKYDILNETASDSMPVDSSWRIFGTEASDSGKVLTTVYRKGGYTDIALLDFASRSFSFLTSDTCADFRPSWSSSANGFYFISDRGGINRVYFYSLQDSSIRVVYSSNYYVYDYTLSSDEDSIYVQDISKDGNSIYASALLKDAGTVSVHSDKYSAKSGFKRSVRLSDNSFYFPHFSGPGIYGFVPYASSLYDTLTNDTSDVYGMISAFMNADDAQMLSIQAVIMPSITYLRPEGYTFYKYDINLQSALYCFPHDVDISVYASRSSNSRGLAPELLEFYISPVFSIVKTGYSAYISPVFQLSSSAYSRYLSFGVSAGISSYESGILSIVASNGYSASIFPFFNSDASAGADYSISLYSKPLFTSVASLNLSGSVSTRSDISTRSISKNLLNSFRPMSMQYSEIGFDSIDSMSDFAFLRGTITTPLLYINRGIPIPLLISSAVRFDCISSKLSLTACRSFKNDYTDLIASESVSLIALAYGSLGIIPSAYCSYSFYRKNTSVGVNLSIN